ncbi:hypothetical protein SteCoe_34384 [Stentor coeruleus]|uniref:Uncharacterized protein n=1 Tax=Stentor coeruleus TaxID=5963 RepID=A0A1R2AUP6_9CILI|nr:hypothetical protein SteCoe_34384 [Stentor coeruleus]
MEGTLKSTKSPKFFQSTRVDSCQYVATKNGQTVAVSFPVTKTGYKAPNSWANQKRSSETISHSGATYRVHTDMHAGMPTKPLVPYNPNSYRSRLPSADYVAPYRNASQFEIGDRTACSAKTVFRTSNQSLLVSKNILEGLTNQGIIAEKTKWHKLRTLD